MSRRIHRTHRLIFLPACLLIGSLAVTMGGCKLSCDSEKKSDTAKIVHEIGDEVQGTVKELKKKD